MRNIFAALLIVAPVSAAYAWDTPPQPPQPMNWQRQGQSQTFAPNLTTTQLNNISLSNAVAARSAANATAQGGQGGAVSNTINNTVATPVGGGSSGSHFIGAPSVGFGEAGGGGICGPAGWSVLGMGGGSSAYGSGLFSIHHEDRQCQLFVEQASAIAKIWCPEAARAWIVHESADMRAMLGVDRLDPTCPVPPPPVVVVQPTPVVHHPHPHPKPAPVCPEGSHMQCVPDHHKWWELEH